MRAKNEAELKALGEKKDDAEKNQGDMEVLDALFDAARFHARVGAKDAAYAACDLIRDRPKISTGLAPAPKSTVGFHRESRRRRGRDVDSPWRDEPRLRRVYTVETSRGDAAPAMGIFRGD